MIQALVQGCRLLKRHKKAVVLYYLSNVLLASLLLPAFMQNFERSLGAGDYRESLVERLDNDWFELFQDGAPALASTFRPSVTGWGAFLRNLDLLLTGRWDELPRELLAIGLIYLLANAYLTGAALASISFDPQGNSVREFFRLGGEFFGRFLRLSLLSLAAFALVYALLLWPWHAWTRDLAQSAVTDRAAGIWSIVGVLSGALVLGFVNLVFDYARIITAGADRSSTLLAATSALAFCIKFIASTASLYLVLALIGLLWTVAMTALEGWIPQGTGAGILAAFIIQQTYLVGRLAIRFYFYTAQSAFYQSRVRQYRGA